MNRGVGAVLSDTDAVGLSDVAGLGESVAPAGDGVPCACGSPPPRATKKMPVATSSSSTTPPATMNGSGIRRDRFGSGSGRRCGGCTV